MFPNLVSRASRLSFVTLVTEGTPVGKFFIRLF